MAIVLFGDSERGHPRSGITYDHLPPKMGVKIGLEQVFSFDEHGVSPLFKKAKAARALGLETILDPKVFAIPKTMRAAVNDLTMLGVQGFTVAAESGPASLRAAVEERDLTYDSLPTELRSPAKPLIFGSCVLSSRTDADCAYGSNPMGAWERKMKLLIADCKASGLDGMVCNSYSALAEARRMWSSAINLATSIRPDWATWIKNEDQRHVIYPSDLEKFGVKYAVIERVATDAPDPYAALKRANTEYGHA